MFMYFEISMTVYLTLERYEDYLEALNECLRSTNRGSWNMILIENVS